MNIFYPFEIFSQWVVNNLFNINNIHLADALDFFIYDTLKILFLIILITHLMGLIRYYLPIKKLRNFLATHKLFGLEYFLATLFGALTPFCSCSSIPLFVGFLGAKIPLGVTFAFLITSPLINEIAIGLFLGIFGVKITGLYIVAGIIIGMLGGFILGKLKMEKYIADFVWQAETKIHKNNIKKIPLMEIFKKVSKNAFQIVKKIFIYIIIGVGIGSLIHGFIPTDFFEKYLAQAGFWGVPLATILAVPFYSNASGVIPIIESLIAKGVPLGTGLAFMMAIVGLSLPEALILKRVLKWQLLITFFGIVTIGIILMGYFFNIIL